ncbi:MAG: DUF4410 domain-containing protein [Syntrophobacteraceae bacterium]
MKKALIFFSVALVLGFFAVSVCAQKSANAAEASVKPTKPDVIYVKDFVMDLPQMSSQQRPRLLNRRGSAQEDPAAKQAMFIEAMSTALTQDLMSKSIRARRFFTGDRLPDKGWLVEGKFIDADEGNRAARMMVGFGAGASNMQVQVSVTDLRSPNRRPFAVFGARSKSGMAPGAVVFMNPYVLAAKFVMSKRHPDRDVKKTAKQIAGVLEKMAAQSPVR